MVAAWVVAVQARLSGRDLSRASLTVARLFVAAIAGHPADRHHLRRRPLGHLHRDRKLLHRRDLRAADHDLRLSRARLERLHARDARRRAHHRDGAADHRRARAPSAG